MRIINITLPALFLLFASPTAIAAEAPDSCRNDLEAASVEVLTDDETDAMAEAAAPDTVVIDANDELPMCCFAVGPSYYREYKGPDFHFLKNTTNYSIKPYTFMQDQTWVGIPVFIAGWIAKSEKKAFQQNYKNSNTRIRLIKYNFHSEVDNYTQFSGIALTAGLKMAGVEGRSSWPRLIASSLASYGVMAAFVNGIKYSAKEMRPDESTKNSWPSGHTATAFVGATILHKEYGLTRSPWYSIAGYTVATATGVMRVLNNRHWISDVLSGAGIGILSTELAYGICDLLFKDRGLLMNDLNIHPDLSKNPSFFAISMGLGFGNKHLELPDFDFEGYGVEHDDKPMSLEFGNATAVGVEAAYFFNRYIGVGARLRVKATPIKKWSAFATDEEIIMKEKFEASELWDGVQYLRLKVQSDHITEFAADAGIYFNLPLSSRFALGTKVLAGRSVMDDVDVDGILKGFKMKRVNGRFVPTDYYIDTKWDYINLSATNSFKFGSGLSLTYAHKNSFSWRVFLDYDYASKTYTASYSPLKVIEEFAPQILEQFEGYNWNPAMTFKSSIHKHLHQWVAGGALCVSF
jgi:membrane-associated phospholipid phosphatase